MCTIVNFKELARDVGGPAIRRHDQVPAAHVPSSGGGSGCGERRQLEGESGQLHRLETELRRAEMVLPAVEVRARSL
jgi:hypothetical protein